MSSMTVASGQTITSRITISGSDTLTVEGGGTVSVSSKAQSVRFDDVTDDGFIKPSATQHRKAA